jgi:hypothetical protein
MKDRQYFMYGVMITYEWFLSQNVTLKMLEDSEDDITGVLHGRDGKYLIIGRIIKEGNGNVMSINKLSRNERLEIEQPVRDNFNFLYTFNHYYVIENKTHPAKI